MNGETPPKTTEAERFDAAMRRALERYDRLSGPGARLHDYVPLKTLERANAHLRDPRRPAQR